MAGSTSFSRLAGAWAAAGVGAASGASVAFLAAAVEPLGCCLSGLMRGEERAPAPAAARGQRLLECDRDTVTTLHWDEEPPGAAATIFRFVPPVGLSALLSLLTSSGDRGLTRTADLAGWVGFSLTLVRSSRDTPNPTRLTLLFFEPASALESGGMGALLAAERKPARPLCRSPRLN